MAGFFGFFDYTKPGPGIPKDAPPKPRFFAFFDIFTRKFWNLVKINVLFFIFNIPAVIAAFLITAFLYSDMFAGDATADMVLRFIIASVFLCIPVITVGPAQAGFTYLLRNYAREEHAFLWWDFKENALKNMKESLIISFVDIVVIILIFIDMRIYFLYKDSLIMSLGSGLLILAFVIYLMMHMYIYPLLVTFKLSIKQVYKNAFIFSLLNFFPNLLVLIVCLGLIFASFYNMIVGFALFPLLTLSTIGLITNYFVYPYLKKHIMDRLPRDPEELEDDPDDEEENENDKNENDKIEEERPR